MKFIIISSLLLLSVVSAYPTTTSSYSPTTTSSYHSTTSKPDCTSGCADVLFLVDGSGSILPEGYADELEFVSNLIDAFPSEIRSGVIVFSDAIDHVLPVAERTSTSPDDISGLSFPNGFTSIGSAINAARVEFNNSGRSECVNHLVVLTDGISDDDVTAPSEAARADGIITYSIAIGNSVNQDQLDAIAGDPSRQFNVTTSAALSDIEDAIEAEIMTCVTTKPTPTCDMSKYCCKPVLVAPYTDHYGNRLGSNIQGFGICQVQAAVIINFGSCSVESRSFRWEVEWGDGKVDSGYQNVIGPFGPVVHTYDYYNCHHGVAEVTVRYCHNSMGYMDECCDSFVTTVKLNY